MRNLKKDCDLLNGADLAYIGDAYFELRIRMYLLSTGLTKNKELQTASLRFVTAKAHHFIFEKIADKLTNEELKIFRVGKNGAPRNHRKNLNHMDYYISSGFEAVIGYLYITENYTRLDEIISEVIKIVEEGNHE